MLLLIDSYNSFFLIVSSMTLNYYFRISANSDFLNTSETSRLNIKG